MMNLVNKSTKKTIIIVAGILLVAVLFAVWFFRPKRSQEVDNGEQVKSSEQQRIKELEQKVESLEGLSQAEIDAAETERLRQEEELRINEQEKAEKDANRKIIEERIQKCEEWQNDCQAEIWDIETIKAQGEQLN